MRIAFIISLLAMLALSFLPGCHRDPVVPPDNNGKQAHLIIAVYDTLHYAIADAQVNIAGYFDVDSILGTMVGWTDEAGRLVAYPTIRSHRDTLAIKASKENYYPDSTKVRVVYDGQEIRISFHLKPL
jgi:hypothetical protein